MIYCYRRDFEAALEQCDQTIELNPHFAPAYLTLGLIQEQRKDFDESAAAFRRAVDLSPHTPRMHGALARTFALSGKLDGARATLRTLEELSHTRYVSPFEFVTIYFALGETDEGIQLAHQGVRRSVLRAAGLEGRPAVRRSERRGAFCGGGKTDRAGLIRPPCAYANGKSTFEAITHTPIFYGWQDELQHIGNFGAKNGGDMGVIARNWLDWTTRGDQKAARMFKGAGCELCKDRTWHVMKKKIDGGS